MKTISFFKFPFNGSRKNESRPGSVSKRRSSLRHLKVVSGSKKEGFTSVTPWPLLVIVSNVPVKPVKSIWLSVSFTCVYKNRNDIGVTAFVWLWSQEWSNSTLLSKMHRENMEHICEEVQKCLEQASFSGKPLQCYRGIKTKDLFHDEKNLSFKWRWQRGFSYCYLFTST